MRIRKNNADHGSSPKKPLTFLPPPPMAPSIIKSKLQSNEAHAQFGKDDETLPIAVANNNDHFEENTIGDEVDQQDTTSDLQLELLLKENENHGEDFLFCGKSSIQNTSNFYENNNVSLGDVAFGLIPTESEDYNPNNSSLHSFHASSTQASHYSFHNVPKSSSSVNNSITMHANGGSNVILVA